MLSPFFHSLRATYSACMTTLEYPSFAFRLKVGCAFGFLLPICIVVVRPRQEIDVEAQLGARRRATRTTPPSGLDAARTSVS